MRRREGRNRRREVVIRMVVEMSLERVDALVHKEPLKSHPIFVFFSIPMKRMKNNVKEPVERRRGGEEEERRINQSINTHFNPVPRGGQGREEEVRERAWGQGYGDMEGKKERKKLASNGSRREHRMRFIMIVSPQTRREDHHHRQTTSVTVKENRRRMKHRLREGDDELCRVEVRSP